MKELKKVKPLSAIYYLIEKVRKEANYKYTKEQAAYILAGNLGIDIAKFLTKEELKELRATPTEIKVVETKSISKVSELKIKGIPKNIPFVDNKIKKDCKDMIETYSLFYLLENSIRNFILDTFDSEFHSIDWWDGKVTKRIKDKVKERMEKEDENRWHAKRGDHPIFHTNFGDLKDIIINNWDIFKKYLPNQNWIVSRLQELELSRNIIAHNNPLPKDETKRIKLYFRDWIKQIKDK